MSDKFINSLLPRSVMLADTYGKLTSALQDVKGDWRTLMDKVRNGYTIDKMDETELLYLIKSFSLKEIYDAMPPYYHGSATNLSGVPYTVAPVSKVVWMRQFIDVMLKLRAYIGVPKMMDMAMGLLGVTADQYVIQQNFNFYDHTTGEDIILPRWIYSKLTLAELLLLGYVYTAAPTAAELADLNTALHVPTGDHYDPTQTISIDLLGLTVADQIGSEFMTALKTLVYFLKPTHVIIEDISQAVYLYTDMMYNINLSRRGDFYSTAYRFTAYRSITADAATNRLLNPTGSLIADGFKPGMLVTVTGLAVNTITNVRITEVANSYLTLDTNDVTLVNEGPLWCGLTGDYDHSFQDALVPFVGTSVTGVNVFHVTAPNRITRSAGDFLADGFKVGWRIIASGFTNTVNNLTEKQDIKILAVTASYIDVAKWPMINEAVTGSVTLQLFDIEDTAIHDLTLPKPTAENTSNTLHPVMHQPGPVPTLATRGSYFRQGQASSRLDIMDTMHFNTLNARGGAQAYFGFCITGSFEVVAPNKVVRSSGSWFDDGFAMSFLVSTSGFAGPTNNVEFAKIIAMNATTLWLDGVAFVNEGPVPNTQVCVDMMPILALPPVPVAPLTLYFTGGIDSDSEKDGNWSLSSGGPGDGRVPTSLDLVMFDAASPNCTLSAHANWYSADTTGYAAIIDLNNFNLTLEENGTLVSGSIIPGTGIFTLNNTYAGTSTFNGVSYDPFFAFVGVVYLKNTTSVDLTGQFFNILKVAGTGVTTQITVEPFIVYSSFNVEGGTVDFTGTIWIADNPAVSTVFGFVAGSDITGSGTFRVTGNTGGELKNVPEMAGTTMAVNFTFETCSPVLTGDLACIDFYIYENGGIVSCTTNGYDVFCTGYFKAITGGGRISIDVTDTGGGGTAIYAAYVDINTTPTHAGVWLTDGSEKIVLTTDSGYVWINSAQTISWLELPDHKNIYLYKGSTAGCVCTVNIFVIPAGCTVHGLGECGWDGITPPGPPVSTVKTVIGFTTLSCIGGAGADEIDFIMPDLAMGIPHYYNVPYQLNGDHSGAVGYVNNVVGGVASVLGW